jgi:hypothetical protein
MHLDPVTRVGVAQHARASTGTGHALKFELQLRLLQVQIQLRRLHAILDKPKHQCA